MLPPKELLSSISVLSKEFLLKHELKALLVEENYLLEEEGRCLMQAFNMMGATTFEWCKSDRLLNGISEAEIHVCDCNYKAFVSDYLEYEDGIQYFDRLMYLRNNPVFVVHTAFEHLIYAGPEEFINSINVIKEPSVIDGWLRVVGSYYPDPELKEAYGLSG